MQSLIESVGNKLEGEKQVEYTVLYNGGTTLPAFVLKNTGELFCIYGSGGWTLFDENEAVKKQEGFEIKEMHYQGLDYLCLSVDDRIYSFLIGDFIESESNIQSWCGECYITKNGDIYDSRMNSIVESNFDLKQWFPWISHSSIKYILITNDNDLYYMDNDEMVLVSNNVNVDEWYNNGYFLQDDDLYFIDVYDNVHLDLALSNVNIKQWYGPYHFITNDNDLYYGTSLIAENVNIKYWYAGDDAINHNCYLTANNDLYDYQGNLLNSNISIKRWYNGGHYITQDNKLYNSNGYLISENVEGMLCTERVYYTYDGKLRGFTLREPQGWGAIHQFVDSNVNTNSIFIESIGMGLGTRDEIFLATNGNIYFLHDYLGDIFISEVSTDVTIKEWYPWGYYLTNDNCLYCYGNLISNNCSYMIPETDSFHTLDGELYINLTYNPSGR